ncbi:MAG: MFS transporter [Oscillospiraceae bacterium]|jgi:fucose permease|nr:MFS transporter [Oscillospiraceae bacterium]
MFSLLLAVIYMSFISLGLPDSLLGSAWPVMQPTIGVPLSFAGIISMIIAGGTICSSLLSDRLTKKLGAGLVTALSVLTTAVALFGFSVSSGSFWTLCLWAIPYGFGAGAVDAALNNFVALHYNSRQMNWLHCFWGVGAGISPYVMSYCLTKNMGWSSGYRIVSILQIILTALLFLSLPLWKKQKAALSDGRGDSRALKISEVLRISGVKYILAAFFGYCALETTAGLWASSFLVLGRGINAETAAKYASLFYIGITVGRFLCGFISVKIGDRNMIRIGTGIIVLGLAAVWLPVRADWLSLYGLVIIGFGCAPIYPSVIHATPDNFGKENSQAVVGVQMASAYVGSTFMPPLFGLIANHVGVGLYPAFLLIFAALMLLMTERLNGLNLRRGA